MPRGFAPASEQGAVVYALLTSRRDKRASHRKDKIMTRFDQAFAALSDRMSMPAAPRRAGGPAPSLTSLIERVNDAKQRYQPGRR